MTPYQLAAIKDNWLRQCAAHDAGMAMSCTCPDGDPRNAIDTLVTEVERLRALVDRDTLREQRDQARAEKGELLRLVAEMLSDPVDNAALVRWHQEYRRLST